MEQSFFGTMQMRILGALLILMVMIALGSYASLNIEKVKFLNPSPAVIAVSGEGEVLGVPDIGRFSFSVMAEAKEAKTAQEESGTKINDILAYLRERGVEDKDIKNLSYNLYPRYRWEERVCAANAYCPPGNQIQDGFTVTQTIEVKVRDTDKAGAIITGVGERGATDISGLEFTIDDTDALKAEARAKAITDAESKAAVLAKQLGVRIVRLAQYAEDGDYYYPKYDARTLAMDAAAEGFGGAEMPVGEEKTTTRVTLTYEVE